ncbi:hypothetical protein PCCS19_48860 [Paenibacillus sp. CCS19]|uniref:hypothetical protein n=1 Tax=Paenibacillus sp. CCS19 TaxID=3158387 RepID=UPI00255EB4AE|nr:hypothetical protein [Paenibacillus cellulosilyticus]GMK41827.1 hypothetical protein PCCS19_48860 [Paenibacillus cellulosilyticus]
MTSYRISIGEHRLEWGSPIDIDKAAASKYSASSLFLSDQGEWDWDLRPGIYYARDIVRQLDTLLEAISIRLGDAADAEALLRNIEASLALSGRESVLSIASNSNDIPSRAEISAQAEAIGQRLSSWAREFNSQRWALGHYKFDALSSLEIRSRCDHHLWTPRVTDLLMGPLGGPVVMQLFNEYLHQIVLLRDALLPFDNWEEVPIELRAGSSGKGLRYIENARVQFLTELLLKQVSHQSIVRLAQAFLSPSLSPVGYGFQYDLGTVLPAGLTNNLASAPKYLLRWHPVNTTFSSTIRSSAAAAIANGTASAAVQSIASAPVPLRSSESVGLSTSAAFVYAFDDYYAAPRSQVGQGDPVLFNERLNDPYRPSLRTEAYLQAAPADTGGQPDRVHLQYELHINGTSFKIDLGQLLRGHRFVYTAQINLQHDPNTIHEPVSLIVHTAQEILNQPDLVTSDKGTHLITTGGDPLIQRALLGKLYPENVILLDHLDENELHAAYQAGKGFGAKFLIH